MLDVRENLKHLDVVKTHDLNVKMWESNLAKSNLDIYFISIERKGVSLYPKNRLGSNHLLLQYEDILEREDYTLSDIINNLYLKYKNFLPSHITLNKDACMTRLKGMNEMVENMKTKPFTVWDNFYGIHGSHRNRGKHLDNL
jgi:hypothetical protein